MGTSEPLLLLFPGGFCPLPNSLHGPFPLCFQSGALVKAFSEVATSQRHNYLSFWPHLVFLDPGLWEQRLNCLVDERLASHCPASCPGSPSRSQRRFSFEFPSCEALPKEKQVLSVQFLMLPSETTVPTQGVLCCSMPLPRAAPASLDQALSLARTHLHGALLGHPHSTPGLRIAWRSLTVQRLANQCTHRGAQGAH